MSTGVYFINLGRRTDRLAHLLKQVVHCPWPVERIEAIDEQPGYIGCAKSHIVALKTFLSSQHDYGLILEDDFSWSIDEQEGWKKIVRFLEAWKEINWNVILISHYTTHAARLNVIPTGYQDSGIQRCIDAQTTAGYLITKKYAHVLLTCFQAALELLVGHRCPQSNAIDIQWKTLQKSDTWLIFHPPLAHQYPNFSDIEGKFVNYKC